MEFARADQTYYLLPTGRLTPMKVVNVPGGTTRGIGRCCFACFRLNNIAATIELED
ncbi:hypothetical protein MtrunA17_Chr4g0056731 [Medicago truncatula]|uniref:Uncharacterized protein n=1 Tax=Medicago truncatula TaxID=3880 RepID=A0A396ICK5_MEDTR|nr:hypothetical protein MtrunA17_Chr4g0056731 [Medicago truncatula]